MQAPSGVRDVVLLRLSAPILARLRLTGRTPPSATDIAATGPRWMHPRFRAKSSQTHTSWSRSQSYHHKQPVPRIDCLGDERATFLT